MGLQSTLSFQAVNPARDSLLWAPPEKQLHSEAKGGVAPEAPLLGFELSDLRPHADVVVN